MWKLYKEGIYSNWVTGDASSRRISQAIKLIKEGLWQMMLLGMRDKFEDPK